MYAELSEAKKTIAPLMSSGSPKRPMGVREVQVVSSSGLASRIVRVSEVTMYPARQRQPAHKTSIIVEVKRSEKEGGPLTGDGVDPDIFLGPLNGQGACHVLYSGLGRVIGCLRLGNVDDAARHRSDEDNCPRTVGGQHVFGAFACAKT